MWAAEDWLWQLMDSWKHVEVRRKKWFLLGGAIILVCESWLVVEAFASGEAEEREGHAEAAEDCAEWHFGDDLFNVE